MKKYKSKFYFGFTICICLLIWTFCTRTVEAAIKSAEDFETAEWSHVASIELPASPAWVQGGCNTENYIVYTINATDANNSPDTIVALYKNPYDENGDPVEQYSIAKQVTERDYEHANAMAYNPNTKEIAIAGYVSANPANKACLFIIDSETLVYKRSVVLTNPGVNILGLDYLKEKDEYVMQTSGEGGNVFFVTDGAFNFKYALDASLPRKTVGVNFQDFCVSGNYIVTTPLMMGISKQQYIEVFSIEEEVFEGRYKMNLPVEAGFVEPETLTEIAPGKIMIMVPVDNPRMLELFVATLPATCVVKTESTNGVVTESNSLVDVGSDYTITYEPKENYGLSSLIIDGEEQDVTKYPTSYTFEGISNNHTISVMFEELPEFKIVTEVNSGTIDKSTKVRQGKSLTISYKPKKFFELAKIYVDGKKIKISNNKNTYTFENIQKEHSVKVVYRWIYLPVVMIIVILIIAWVLWCYRIRVIRRRKRLNRRRTEKFISRIAEIEDLEEL